MRVYYRKKGKKNEACILNVEWVKIMEMPFSNEQAQKRRERE